MKIFREVADDTDVAFCGTMRVITTLDFLQHLFAKLGHRDLLSCDPSYLNPFSSSSAGVHARGSVRRDSGFVQIPIAQVDQWSIYAIAVYNNSSVVQDAALRDGQCPTVDQVAS